MSQEELLSEILKRLNVLISLELEKPLAETATSMSDRMARLHSLGLTASEIAVIVGKRTNYVTAYLAKRRASSDRKRGSKG